MQHISTLIYNIKNIICHTIKIKKSIHLIVKVWNLPNKNATMHPSATKSSSKSTSIRHATFLLQASAVLRAAFVLEQTALIWAALCLFAASGGWNPGLPEMLSTLKIINGGWFFTQRYGKFVGFGPRIRFSQQNRDFWMFIQQEISVAWMPPGKIWCASSGVYWLF